MVGLRAVRDMSEMFISVNQDISGWAVDSVTSMVYMFNQAFAFDQDLGWCVDDMDLSDELQ